MIENERDVRAEQIIAAGRQMMTAARTAPKGKGVDLLEIKLVSGKEINELAAEMRAMSAKNGLKFFLRDADNIEQAGCILIIGTRAGAQGLNCGYCGFPSCDLRALPTIPCAINSIDVGIAVGSACATAADLRVDTRVMFSVGQAALSLGWLPQCSQALGIPVSASSKNPFFDRKPAQ
jgi:uncharacterized ferredoxin-like protein